MIERTLSALRVDHFRCLEGVLIEPHSRLNLVTGANAAGKTSLLEAIHVLARGRSFRGARLAECLRHDADRWRVAARLQLSDGPPDVLDLVWRREGVRLSCNSEAVSLAEVARRVPVQLIEPSLHRLVEEGPAYRRRYLDWGLFHVEPSYLDDWRRFAHALRQRNTVLRSRGSDRDLRVWDHVVAESGERVQAMRQTFVEGWQSRFVIVAQELLELEVGVKLSPGWAEGEPLMLVLESRRAADRQQLTTTAGPHRAELRLYMDGQAVRGTVSRGQQKMLVAALVISQALYMREVAGVSPILLLDDFTAELGPEFQTRLARTLRAYPGQTIVTAIEAEQAADMLAANAMFHVEHGRVKNAE